VTPHSAFAASLLRSSSRAYAMATIDRLSRQQPELLAGGLPETFASPAADTEVRILHLAESVAVDRPALLQDAVAWYKVAFHHRGVPAGYLAANLAALREALANELPPVAAQLVERHLALAVAHLATAPVELPSAIDAGTESGRLAGHFLLSILEGRGGDGIDAIRAALAGGMGVPEVHDRILLPVQRETGRMWLMGEIPVADEHYGSQIVERVLWLLQERIPPPPAGARRILTMGVGGNLHDLGLRMVAQQLQLAGFHVHHLGADMPCSDLEWALHDRQVDLVAMSAVLTLHLDSLARTLQHLRQLEARHGWPRRAVLVGGAPFAAVPDLHVVLGADAAAVDAGSAVAAARALLGA
jgi:methanogenic corrinoid protein MtbC1